MIETIIIVMIGTLTGGMIGWLWHDNRKLRIARNYLAETLAKEYAENRRLVEANLEMSGAAAEMEQELADSRRALMVQIQRREGVPLADV